MCEQHLEHRRRNYLVSSKRDQTAERQFTKQRKLDVMATTQKIISGPDLLRERHHEKQHQGQPKNDSAGQHPPA